MSKLANNLTGYPSIDKPWLKYYSEEIINADEPQGNMYEYMYECTKNLSNNCMDFFGKKISYKTLYRQIDRTAAALSKMGMKKGDVVSLCLLTIPENYYLLYAVNMLGGICNYVAVNNSVVEMEKRIISTKSKIVFTVNLAEENILKAVGEKEDITIVSIPLYNSMPVIPAHVVKTKMKYKRSDRVISWKEFIKSGKGFSYERESGHADLPAIIEYTSGTTGESKGALHPNKTANHLAANYKGMGDEMVFHAGDKYLNILPPFYAYGIFVGTHMPICLGVEVFLTPSPDPQGVAKAFVKCKPNHFLGSPNHINAVLSNAKVQKMDLSFLKIMGYGGDSVNESWTSSINKFLENHNAPNKVIQGYGMTEVAGTFCTATQKREGMIPFPKNNIKILDVDTGEEKKYGEEGEVYISGQTLMNGYFGDEEHTSASIMTDNGVRWLKTGDLGYVTAEGYLVISGRLKRIYWTVGNDGVVSRVYPMKIEAVLDTHHNVKQVAVVGIQNKERGYITIAVLVLNDIDSKEATIDELKELCKQELDESSCPFKYRVVESIELTAAGKVDYKKIEDMLTNQE